MPLSKVKPGIDDNSDATAITIDSSEQVGIGATSPRSNLEISDSSGGELTLRYTGNSGFAAIKTDGNSALSFSSGATSFTERMQIDSAGRITSPSQPRFSINGGPNSYQDSSNTETTVLHGQSGVFANDVNNGSHFSYTNGRFTAPVAGQYMFTYTLSSGDTNSHFIEIRKNGNSVTTVLLYGLVYNSGCHSTILTLAANDYVDARRRGTSYSVYSAVFSGYLMG
jgi:hypothetical protein